MVFQVLGIPSTKAPALIRGQPSPHSALRNKGAMAPRERVGKGIDKGLIQAARHRQGHGPYFG